MRCRYVGYYKFTTPVLLLKDPELIKQICVRDYDAFSERTTLIPDGAEPLWTNNLFASKCKCKFVDLYNKIGTLNLLQRINGKD